MTELRILNVILWAALLIYMLPGAWSASFGKHARRGDPMRLAVGTTALIMVGFNLRWLLIPNNDQVWGALYALSAVNALYIAWLAKAYGRGPKL